MSGVHLQPWGKKAPNSLSHQNFDIHRLIKRHHFCGKLYTNGQTDGRLDRQTDICSIHIDEEAVEYIK